MSSFSSGTLDPSIQETTGRPKRDINTILQILNDLLVASPQLRDSSNSMKKSFDQQTMHTSPVLGECLRHSVNFPICKVFIFAF